MHARTHACTHANRFLPCDVDEKKSKLAKEMKLHFPPEVLDWVSTEMLQNREKKQVGSW